MNVDKEEIIKDIIIDTKAGGTGNCSGMYLLEDCINIAELSYDIAVNRCITVFEELCQLQCIGKHKFIEEDKREAIVEALKKLK